VGVSLAVIDCPSGVAPRKLHAEFTGVVNE